jgi:glycerophosphoryl diester phosphodiesterase
VTVTLAHRGDPVGHRENTLEAFESARALGADMIELDCKLTRDGHVAVLHDNTLTRLWGVPKPVRQLDWDQVRAIKAGGYRIPDLAEVLATVPLPVMVDVSGVEVLEGALAVAQAANATDRCVFAGATDALVRLRQVFPAARIALTWDNRRLPGAELLEATRPEWFNPFHGLVTPRTVERMHAARLAVSVWTVDHLSDIRRVLNAGVDAVISNQIARLVAAVDEAAGGPRARPQV